VDKNMLSCLKGMADIMSRRWEEELEETDDTQYALVYAQLATAFAALNAPKPFLQIGPDFFNRSDIVRVEIKEADGYYSGDPKKIHLYTRDLVGSECYSSCSTCHVYKYHSPEGQTLLEWLQGQSEVLIPYEDPVHVQPDYEDSVNREFQADEEAYLAGQEEGIVGITLAEANDEEPGHPF